MSTYRVVLHAPTEQSLTRARSNAANIAAAQPAAIVEIVVNADGARAAVQTPHLETDELIRYCANSLKKQNLDAPKGAKIIGSAVLHLIERQGEGWAYVRS
ncbi:MAG: hypothetical protein AB8B88_13445 [Devosiaceae bacterium]